MLCHNNRKIYFTNGECNASDAAPPHRERPYCIYKSSPLLMKRNNNLHYVHIYLIYLELQKRKSVIKLVM